MHDMTCTTSGNGFKYHYERNEDSRRGMLGANEDVIVMLPKISAGKRGINDIGWQTDGAGVSMYGTFSQYPESEHAIWSKIDNGTAVNKTVTALRLINKGTPCNVSIKVIMF